MADRTAKLTIGDNSYLMTFGLGCLARLNQKYVTEKDGIKLSVGIPNAMAELALGNFEVVADLIRFSTADNVNRPSEAEIEAYIDMRDQEDDTTVFDDFLTYLKMVPGAKRFFKEAEVAQQAMEKTEKKSTKK